MTIYTCAPDWESMLSCIYVAWGSGKGHKNIRLMTEPIAQYTLFDEYIHVDKDPQKARSVMDSVNRKISPGFYHDLAWCGMAYEEDALDNIYRVMILGFHFGASALKMMQYRDVMRNREICKRVSGEAHHFKEFIRFHLVENSFYAAHIEPKSRILPAIAPHFADRMPSENWIIVDDVHLVAAVHPKDERWFLQLLSEKELQRLRETERHNDGFTDLWKTYFDVIAIEERRNTRCQKNLFPKWLRKHAVEFN